ncbi:Mitochondrial fusion and transport protein UGO1 [Wickerhamiella sorbophila]|uniref:Mitochondrial fusion and transport protein UGO1 n=1 Tax=Wickerhamiella sorbophila TaxID=45607 RepID=A0A2T0FN46_9ASCO|nr:Mitochondrial fusion and transport protein UGO1 [Wickerhamiella sorbophila]PRT56404.1 Mitochondrial fusion and transport protein UGO1 [Wickerhamiella sorbophila]
MNYRPYYDPETFASPVAVTTSLPGQAKLRTEFDFDYLDDLNQSPVGQVGLSIAKFYSRMVVVQPFDVAKFLVQVSDVGNRGGAQLYEDELEDSDEEEIDYFLDTSSPTPRQITLKSAKLRKLTKEMQLVKSDPALSAFPEATPVQNAYIWNMISLVAEKEGPVGMWKAMHTSCLYQASKGLLYAWLCGLLSSLVGVQDPLILDVLQSPDPLMAVAVTTVASGLAAALLAPLAVIRARFIVTVMQIGPRSLRGALLGLKSIVGPVSVAVPSAASSSIIQLVDSATPYLLFKHWNIDQFRYRGMYHCMVLCSKLLALAFKIPLDTFANRAAVASQNLDPKTLIVVPRPYNGMLYSLWDIFSGKDSILSLYRGWRPELLGCIGAWGVDAIDVNSAEKERF